MRKSKYTRELLDPIVAASSSVTDVIRRLGLHATGGDRHARKRMLPDSEVFIENAAPINGSSLTKRLLRECLAYLCVTCGINEWLGKPLRLHLDHINGINNDNRRENLRLLCPNCHSQTDTYGRRPSRASEASSVLYGWGFASVVKWQTRRL